MMKAGDFHLVAVGFLVCWTLHSSFSFYNGERGLPKGPLSKVEENEQHTQLLLVDMDVQQSSLLLEHIQNTSTATTVATERKITPKRTLVVYSGPSTYKEEKRELYQLNLEYFLRHGGIILDGDCKYDTPSPSSTSSIYNNNPQATNSIHDTIVVVGHEYYEQQHSAVEKWKAKEATRRSCPQDQWTNQVRVVARRSACYDMESARLAFYGGLGVQVEDYDYFVFLNCGITGPGAPPSLHGLPWTTAFTSKLNDKVKMSGLSLNMFGLDSEVQEPHLQSFLYALDRVGIQLIRDKKAIFDCLAEPAKSENKQEPSTEIFFDIVQRYEIGMSAAILDAGYALAPYLNHRQPQCDYLLKEEITYNNREKKCLFGDMWRAKVLKRMFWGRFPTLNETLFFKTSRLIPLEIAREIGYDAKEDIVWVN